MKSRKQINRSRLPWIGVILPLLALACRSAVPTSVPETSQPLQITQPTSVISSPAELIVPKVVEDEQELLIALYERINPAIVNIIIYTSEAGDLIPVSQGSGFLFDQAGNIITNAHVIHGADEIEVRFPDGTIRSAGLAGEDLNSDLAVLLVDDLPQGILPLTLGNIDEVKVGQTVVAIGNPFGLDGTLTRGIVSAIGRTIPALTPFSIPKAIQTDAPINPGNSGGPLLNLKGEVIGVNAQIETDGESRANSGVGFAIPVSIVQRVVPALIAEGEYTWPWLGVRGTNLTPFISKAMDLVVEKGAYITDIIASGPAAKAGLQGAGGTTTVDGRLVSVGGDVITAIDSNPIYSFDDLLIYVALQTSPGQEVVLTVLREGEPVSILLKLEPRPDSLRVEDSFENP